MNNKTEDEEISYFYRLFPGSLENALESVVFIPDWKDELKSSINEHTAYSYPRFIYCFGYHFIYGGL
jgi:hypothetical protein